MEASTKGLPLAPASIHGLADLVRSLGTQEPMQWVLVSPHGKAWIGPDPMVLAAHVWPSCAAALQMPTAAQLGGGVTTLAGDGSDC